MSLASGQRKVRAAGPVPHIFSLSLALRACHGKKGLILGAGPATSAPHALFLSTCGARQPMVHRDHACTVLVENLLFFFSSGKKNLLVKRAVKPHDLTRLTRWPSIQPAAFVGVTALILSDFGTEYRPACPAVNSTPVDGQFPISRELCVLSPFGQGRRYASTGRSF